jgi:hypothetical protein
MKTNDLTSLSPATLAALARVTAAAAKATRPELAVGKHKVAETIELDLSGLVNVGDDYEQEIVGKAKPWNIVVTLLEEANRRLLAAGEMGIDLARIVEMAENADPELVKAAKAEADKQVKGFKAPTLTQCKGKVTVKAQAALTPEAEEAKPAASIFSGPAQV